MYNTQTMGYYAGYSGEYKLLEYIDPNLMILEF